MFRLKEIVDITAAREAGIDSGLEITGISTDSRQIKKGELFVALSGEHFDGADFVNDAIKKGAAAAIVKRDFKEREDLGLIKVKDTRQALCNIAKAHRIKFDIPVIGITGSTGKTTTKDIIAHILNKRFKVLKTEGNYNNQVGLAKTLFRLNDHDIAVIEIGTNSCGEIRRNSLVLKPTMALITNIGLSHLEGLKDKEGVFNEKIAIVESLEKGATWVKNADDEMLTDMNYKKIRVVSYGIENDNADFKASYIRQTDGGMEFKLEGLGALIRTGLFGMHNVYNVLAAIAACSLFVDTQFIKDAISDFKGVRMRSEILNADGFTIINDCYNSNPLSLRYALECLKGYPASGRRVAVVADMLELGRDSQRLHYESGKFLAEAKAIDFLITYGERSLDITRGAIDYGMDKKRIHSFKEKDRIAPFLRTIIQDGDVVLIKGSRKMKMEEIADCFITCSTR